MNFKIGVDFDGTVVKHRFPEIGEPVPGALEYLRRFRRAGAKLILNTMRGPAMPGKLDGRDTLAEARLFLANHRVFFYGINQDPDQKRWTLSPKAYAHIYIDDAAFGCPLNTEHGERPYVDWKHVGPAVLRQIKEAKELSSKVSLEHICGLANFDFITPCPACVEADMWNQLLAEVPTQ